MLYIKVLTGPVSGTTYQIKPGDNIVGREANCDLQIPHASISRKHFKITKQNENYILQDLSSSNGTFVNGILVKTAILQAGDKITVNEIFIEITEQQNSLAVQNELQVQGNNALNLKVDVESATGAVVQNSLLKTLQSYIENVALPGVYKLAEWAEFRWLLGSFILIYIFMVTLLAIVPMIQISKERIEQESQLRATDISKNLANRYRAALNTGLGATFTIEEERVQGVQTALVVDANDGHILAPARKIGQNPDLPFVHVARKKVRGITKQITDSLIGASTPIQVLNPDTGERSIRAFSIVIYDMGSRAIRTSDVLRLFVQVLAFAILLGFILYFLLYKLIEYPIKNLNQQIDQALKEGTDETSVPYNYPPIQRLSVNINSALSRIGTPLDHDLLPTFDVTVEANNVVKVIKSPAMIIDMHNTIIAINSDCENLIGANGGILYNRPIEEIPDGPLLLNLQDILQTAISNPNSVASGNIEFRSIVHDIEAQVITDTNGPRYVIVTITDQNAGGF